MDPTEAISDLERLTDGMLGTVTKGGSIARTEVIELQRRVAVVREAVLPASDATEAPRRGRKPTEPASDATE